MKSPNDSSPLIPLVLFCFGAVLAFGLGELGVRFLDLAPQLIFVGHGRYQLSSNPEIGYKPAPGAKNMSSLLGWDYPDNETNTLGFRSPDYSKEKPAHTFRTVLIGDSLSMGLWIDRYQDTFAAQVETHLQNYLNRFQVQAQLLNFGVTGYNTKQEVGMLEEQALAYQPDLILLEYCLNDSYRNDDNMYSQLLEQSKNKAGAPRQITLHPILAKSALIRFVYLRVATIRKKNALATERETAEQLERLSRDSTEESLRRLGGIARNKAIPVFVAIFPDFRFFTEDGLRTDRDRVANIAREEGMVVLDLMSSYLNCAKSSSERLNFEGYHPSVAGHHCAGRAIAEGIEGHLNGKPGSGVKFQ